MSTQKPQTIIIFGIQGSGKGTQAQLLEEYFNTKTDADTLYLETGSLLRDFMAKDGYTNKLVEETVSNGELLPSFVPTYVLGRSMIEQFDGSQHLIFDGATRRVNQTVMLDNMLRFYKRTPYSVVFIELPEDEAVERLKLRGRDDDTEEKIRRRIAWSQEHSNAVMEQFKECDCEILMVDGTPSVEEVHQSILTALGFV